MEEEAGAAGMGRAGTAADGRAITYVKKKEKRKERRKETKVIEIIIIR